MTLARPLVWKEWAESRSILFIGTIIFLVLPLIGALERIIQYRGFEFWASPWVVMLGGVLAIVAGVGVIIPDVTRRFEFIRSQPIPLAQWIVTKYLIGIAVVVPTLFVPLALEFVIARTSEFSGYYLAALLAALPFTWIAIYSIAFALACIIRRTSLAIVAAIFAMLVLYFLPPLIPSLQFLSLKQVCDDLTHATLGRPTFQLRGSVAFHSGYFLFAFTLLAISAVALLIAVKVINHDWQIRSNRKTITWAIGILVLAPLATASLHLGSNMPVLQTLDLENQERPFRLLAQGEDMVLVTHYANPRTAPGERFQIDTYFRRLTAGPTISLGPRISAGTSDWLPFVMSSVHDVFYSMSFGTTRVPLPPGQDDNRVNVSYPILVATRLPKSGSESLQAETESLKLPELEGEDYGMPIYAFNQSTLNVITGRHQLTFNIADPIHPMLTAHKILSSGVRYSMGQSKVEFLYPPDCDVPGDQLMAAYNQAMPYDGTGDGQTYLRPIDGGLLSFVRSGAGPGYVQFNYAGEYRPLPIDRLIGNDRSDWIAINNGFAATNAGRVLLFDMSDPSRPRRIGHYISPTERTQLISVLPDGRVVVDVPAHSRSSDGTSVGPKLAILGKP